MKSTGVNQKDFGYELLWASDENYSGKIIVFDKKNACTDMIFHKEKNKSIFVNNGKIKLKWIDTQNGNVCEAILDEGQTANIIALQPHQFKSITDYSSITEVGSAELENDTFIIVSSSAE